MISENISRYIKYESFRKVVQEEMLPKKALYFSTIINWYYEEEEKNCPTGRRQGDLHLIATLAEGSTPNGSTLK